MSCPDDVPYSVQVNAETVPSNRPQVLSMCPLHFKVLTAHDLMLYNCGVEEVQFSEPKDKEQLV
jgi:hypothetical protein